MMHRLTTLAALSATLLAFGCTTPRSRHLRSGRVPPEPAPLEVATLPIPGSRHSLPSRTGHVLLLLVSPANLQPAYKVRFQGVVYLVALQGGGEVVHVHTDDPRFQSPEGLRVGDSLQRVRELGGGKPVARPFWGDYVSALPSGWYAAFSLPERPPYPDPLPEARVRWFFQADRR